MQKTFCDICGTETKWRPESDDLWMEFDEIEGRVLIDSDHCQVCYQSMKKAIFVAFRDAIVDLKLKRSIKDGISKG